MAEAKEIRILDVVRKQLEAIDERNKKAAADNAYVTTDPELYGALKHLLSWAEEMERRILIGSCF